MTAKTQNIRKALEQLLEYVKLHSFVVGDKTDRFVLSDTVINSNCLMRETLEQCGCLQSLGRLDFGYEVMWRNRYPSRKEVIAVARSEGINFSWNRKAWILQENRIDEVFRQLLLNKPLLEEIERQYRRGPQVRLVGETEGPIDYLPWRTDPG